MQGLSDLSACESGGNEPGDLQLACTETSWYDPRRVRFLERDAHGFVDRETLPAGPQAGYIIVAQPRVEVATETLHCRQLARRESALQKLRNAFTQCTANRGDPAGAEDDHNDAEDDE